MTKKRRKKEEGVLEYPVSNESPKSIGRYEILGELGRGGMGVVYRARDRKTKQLFALKIINSEHLSRPESALRFKREFRAMRQVQHPNVIRVFQAGTHNECPFFTMEIVEGKEICNWLDGKEQIVHTGSSRPPDGVLPPEIRAKLNEPRRMRRAAEAMSQVALALGAIHGHRIVHRDVKPDNILVSRAGVVKLMDFGVAKQGAGKNESSSGGLLVGTFKYLSPEQASGADVDARADLYCLGIIFFELLAGRHPFHSDTSVGYAYHHAKRLPPPISRFNPECPKQLVAVCQKLLSKDPDDRYPSAEDVVVAIREAIRGQESDKPLDAIKAASPDIHLFPPRHIGRKEEVDRLRQICRAPPPHGTTVIVSGPSQIGKTRLLKEVAAQARVQSIEVVAGECLVDSDSPYHPYIQIFTKIVDEAADRGIDALTHLLQDDMPILARYIPRIEYHLDDPEFEQATPLEPRAERVRFVNSVTTVLERWQRGHTRVVVIEDLQYADELSLALAEHLVNRQRKKSQSTETAPKNPKPILFFISLDPEHDKAGGARRLLKRVSNGPNIQDLTLQPLSSENVGRMLATMTGGADIAPALADALHQVTQGLPGRAEARVYDWVESNKLQRQDRRWVLLKDDSEVSGPALLAENIDEPGRQTGFNPLIPGDDSEIPATKVIELGAATRADIPLPVSDEKQPARHRLMRLSPAGRDVAERMAIMGEQILGTLAERLALRPEDEFLDALNELLAHNIVSEEDDDGIYRFSALHRKVLVEELEPKRRRSLHQLAARALEEQPSARLFRVNPIQLAQHYLRGGEPQNALRHQMKASREALMANATQTAAEHVRRAQGILAKYFPDKNDSQEVLELDANLVLLRLDVLNAVGEFKESINLANRRLPALRSGLRGKLVAEVLVRLAANQMAVSDLESALAHLSEALSITERAAAHSLRCKIKALCGNIYGRKGLHDLSQRYWREALELAGIIGDRGEEDRAKAALAVFRRTRGELASARADFDMLLTMAERRNEKIRMGYYLSQLADIDLEENLLAQAEEKYLQSIQFSTPGGDRNAVVACLLRLSRIRTEQNNIEAALSLCRKAERILKKSDSLRLESAINLAYAHILLSPNADSAGLEQGAKNAAKAAEISKSIGEIAPELESLFLVGLAQSRLKNTDEAWKILSGARIRAEDLQDNQVILIGLLCITEHLHGTDDFSGAKTFLRRGLARAERTQFERLAKHYRDFPKRFAWDIDMENL
jgi:serine/threonine protein kinase/tetratricopeptide (TPR) repeat protein